MVSHTCAHIPKRPKVKQVTQFNLNLFTKKRLERERERERREQSLDEETKTFKIKKKMNHLTF